MRVGNRLRNKVRSRTLPADTDLAVRRGSQQYDRGHSCETPSDTRPVLTGHIAGLTSSFKLGLLAMVDLK